MGQYLTIKDIVRRSAILILNNYLASFMSSFDANKEAWFIVPGEFLQLHPSPPWEMQVLLVLLQACRVRHCPANFSLHPAHNLLDIDLALFPVDCIRNVSDLEYVSGDMADRVSLFDRSLHGSNKTTSQFMSFFHFQEEQNCLVVVGLPPLSNADGVQHFWERLRNCIHLCRAKPHAGGVQNAVTRRCVLAMLS